MNVLVNSQGMVEVEGKLSNANLLCTLVVGITQLIDCQVLEPTDEIDLQRKELHEYTEMTTNYTDQILLLTFLV